MKNYSEHSFNVYKCLEEINKTIDNYKFNTKSKAAKIKIIENIIKEKSKFYGLKCQNIDMIYNCRCEKSKPKPLNVY